MTHATFIGASALACAFVAALVARDRVRRAESRAQSNRVHVLERSLELKEERERAATGQLEGTIVAGLYRIGQRMGAGAAGVIYQAQRVSDGLPVALKFLRAAAAHEPIAADRLRREAEALRLAWHPNIVEILDQGHLAGWHVVHRDGALDGRLARRAHSKSREIAARRDASRSLCKFATRSSRCTRRGSCIVI